MHWIYSYLGNDGHLISPFCRKLKNKSIVSFNLLDTAVVYEMILHYYALCLRISHYSLIFGLINIPVIVYLLSLM